MLTERALWSSWWVILFLLACCVLFEHSIYPQRQEYTRLLAKLNELEKAKIAAEGLRLELYRKVNSESDLAWIELTLINGLGLVPEGQTKAFFQHHE